MSAMATNPESGRRRTNASNLRNVIHLPTKEENEKQFKESLQENAKKPAHIDIVMNHLYSGYEFALSTDGEVYAIPRKGPRLAIALGEKGQPLKAQARAAIWQNLTIAVSTESLDKAVEIVMSEAYTIKTTSRVWLRSAIENHRIYLDLAQPGSASCVHIHGGLHWVVMDEPPKGILFRRSRATKPLPTPKSSKGRGYRELRLLLGLRPNDPHWLIIRGWLVAALFPRIPRPMLCFVGAAGSGKTTRGKFVVSVLDPRDELGASFGKNQEDDQINALAHYIVSHDNVSSLSKSVSDHLCRMVTGEEASKRSLYTDTGLTTVTYKRTGVITAINVPLVAPDALERIIPLHMSKLTSPTSLQKLQDRFDRIHAEILGDVLDDLVKVLGEIDDVRHMKRKRMRMADFDDVLYALGPEYSKAYHDSCARVMREAAEDDPFVMAVYNWLVKDGPVWTGTPTEAYEQASKHGGLPIGNREQWWPKNARGFSQSLSVAEGPLRSQGITFSRGRAGSRQMTFRLAGERRATDSVADSAAKRRKSGRAKS